MNRQCNYSRNSPSQTRLSPNPPYLELKLFPLNAKAIWTRMHDNLYKNMLITHDNSGKNILSQLLKAHFHPWCIVHRDTLILDFVLHEITEFSEANLHRLFPKQSLEYFSFSCCKYFLLLSLFIFLKVFCKYSVYIHRFCSVKTMCAWRNGPHYMPSCWETKVTWLFEVDSVQGICF